MQNNANNRQTSSKKMDIYYKILLIGPRRVGKTQILKRICKEDFNENYSPSLGLDFRIQKYPSENLIVQINELADKTEIAQDVIKEHMIDADCFICIYDITNINSVRELSDLVSYYEQFIPSENKKQCWYFVGNKSDDKNRECSNRPENLFNYTPYGNIGFIEVSAKENKYIDSMFRNAIMRIGDLRKVKIEEKTDLRASRKSNKNIVHIKENNMDSMKRLNNKENNGNNNNDNNNNIKKDKTEDIKIENKNCEIF